MSEPRGALAPLSKKELIGLVAAAMALNALTIDMMLAALGDIERAFSLTNENDRQLVIIVYVFGAGVATLFYGPLADRYGRRAVLIGSTAAFILSTLLCVVASNYSLFLTGRVLQGVTSAAGRVVIIALVRDLYKGREMAHIMSIAMTIGMISPIVAPSLGQLILFVAPWRYVFVTLFVAGAMMLAWTAWRLPETLSSEDRQPLSFAGVGRMISLFARERIAVGYTLGAVCINGALMAYITSAQQILVETYGLGARFPVVLGGVAFSVSAAAMLNARLVRIFGMRRLSHIAVIAFTLINALNALFLETTGGGFAVYIVFIVLAFFTMGLINSNFSAIIMEPMGKLAGTASTVLSFSTMTFGALIGGVAARLYNGTATPVVIAFAALGAAAILAVIATERGRLFEDHAA